MAPNEDKKWRATVTLVIPTTVDKVWAVVSDFDGVQKYFPQFVKSCEIVEGDKNKVGSVRNVTSVLPGVGIVHGRERLLSCDDGNHTISYSLEKIDLDWTGYVGHVSCETVENEQTLVKWSYELDPIRDQVEKEFAETMSGFYVQLLQIVKAIVAK